MKQHLYIRMCFVGLATLHHQKEVIPQRLSYSVLGKVLADFLSPPNILINTGSFLIVSV